MTHLSRLFAHLEWADARTLKALRAASALEPATLELYAHILGAEATWLARLGSRTPEVAVWPSLTLDQCETLAAANARGFQASIERLTETDLGRGITYRNSAGDTFTSTVEDILLHVAMHGAYHRGQVARALRQAGAVPEPTDYIAFIRGGAAATRR